MKTYTDQNLPIYADVDVHGHGLRLGIVENIPPETVRVMVSHRLSSDPTFAVCYDRDRCRLVVPVASLRPVEGWNS